MRLLLGMGSFTVFAVCGAETGQPAGHIHAPMVGEAEFVNQLLQCLRPFLGLSQTCPLNLSDLKLSFDLHLHRILRGDALKVRGDGQEFGDRILRAISQVAVGSECLGPITGLYAEFGQLTMRFIVLSALRSDYFSAICQHRIFILNGVQA